LSTLTDLKNSRLYKADHGSPGKGKTMTGKKVIKPWQSIYLPPELRKLMP